MGMVKSVCKVLGELYQSLDDDEKHWSRSAPQLVLCSSRAPKTSFRVASSSTLSFGWVLGSVQSWYCLGGTASFCVRWKSHCSEKLFTWLLTTILDFPYDPVNSSSKIACVMCSVAPCCINKLFYQMPGKLLHKLTIMQILFFFILELVTTEEPI